MHKKDLTSSRQFLLYGLDDNALLKRGYICDDRQSVFWRCADQGHVPDAHHRKMKCTRNGSRRKRQNIDVFSHGFQLFLVTHTEALFLINYEQSQILESDIS